MNDVNKFRQLAEQDKPYLDKEFKELAEKVGLIAPADFAGDGHYYTGNGTRFYIDRRLQMFAKELVEQTRQQTAKESVKQIKRHFGVEE